MDGLYSRGHGVQQRTDPQRTSASVVTACRPRLPGTLPPKPHGPERHAFRTTVPDDRHTASRLHCTSRPSRLHPGTWIYVSTTDPRLFHSSGDPGLVSVHTSAHNPVPERTHGPTVTNDVSKSIKTPRRKVPPPATDTPHSTSSSQTLCQPALPLPSPAPLLPVAAAGAAAKQHSRHTSRPKVKLSSPNSLPLTGMLLPSTPSPPMSRPTHKSRSHTRASPTGVYPLLDFWLNSARW